MTTQLYPNTLKYHIHTYDTDHVQILGQHENPRFSVKKLTDFSNRHNFATIGPILEILDVLSSPDRVLSNFDTFVR